MISAYGGDGHPNPDFNKSTQENWGDSAPRFLTAYGSFDTRAVTLHDGKTNTLPQAGQPYESISWAEIRKLVAAPAARPKNSAQFVILSTYTECDGRTHKAQREFGQFWGLAVDIDAGNPPLSAVEAAVRDVAAGAAVIIYSSSSASPENHKWRAMIPLHSPLAGADYPDTQRAVFELLGSRGLRCDITLARAGQPIYLPNVPPKRRAKDGRPLFYQSQYIEGRPLDLSPGSIIVEAREALRARRTAEQADEATQAAAFESLRQACIDANGDDFHPIGHFNANNTVSALLARHKFEQNPRRKNHYRSPLSESNSYSTEDYGDYWVTVSAWAHKHDVGRVSRSGNRYGDAFALHAHFAHGGNQRAAVLAYVQKVRPDLFAALRHDQERLDAFLAYSLNTRPRREAEIEKASGRGEARSLEEMRQEIAAGIATALLQPGAVHLFRPPTGSGKTTLVLEGALLSREAAVEAAYLADKGEVGASAHPTSFAMSLPTHTLVREVYSNADSRGLHPTAYPERTEANCGQIEKASNAAAMGLNVYSAVCESCCSLAKKCRESGYLAGVKESNASEFKIGTHDRAVVAGKMTEGADAIFIDEDPAKALAPNYRADIADISTVLRWAEGIRDDLHVDGRQIVEADSDQRAFADALVDAAERMLFASEGANKVDLPLPPEQEAAARAQKALALISRRADRWRTAGALKDTREKSARLRKRLKKVSRQLENISRSEEDTNEQIVRKLKEEATQLKDAAAQVAARLKDRTKHARAAVAAIKRIRQRPLTSFSAARPECEFATYPSDRVIRIELLKDIQAPDNWSALVFRWAQRYGAGKAVTPEARKIVMLAATGGLESLFVVRAEHAKDPGRFETYVFAKGRTAIPRNKPVIALDATADAEALRAMTGREVIDHTPAGYIALAHAAIQFTTDLTADTSPAEAANVLEAIMTMFPDKKRIGVIGWRKAIRGMMEDEHLSNSVRHRIAKTAYFWQGPDRGSNDWIKPTEEGGAGCDLLIVLGTPRPGTEPVRMALISMNLIGAACLHDGDWGPRQWQGQRPDGSVVIVEASGYRNADWHRAYCLIVRAMLVQAIGRARASLPGGIPVVAVTIEPTGLPAADPLPIMGTEIRQTTETVRLVAAARSAVCPLEILRGQTALRGWVPTSEVISALAKAVGPRRGLSKRAAVARIERAVAAGQLVRGPVRGWVGLAGDCDHWPAGERASSKPSASRLAPRANSDASDTVARHDRPADAVTATPRRSTASAVIAANAIVAPLETGVVPQSTCGQVTSAWTLDPSLETANVQRRRPR